MPSLSAEVLLDDGSKEGGALSARGKAKAELQARRANKAVDQILAIQGQSAQEADELGFIARLLIQATMPHRKPVGHEWSRTNGRLSMHMMAPSAVGLPYGSYARLLLVWITTQAVRNKFRMDHGYINEQDARRLEFGESLSGFMSELGLRATGGENGTITALREQMTRLFSTAVTATFTEYQEHTGQVVNRIGGSMVAEKAELWWDARHPNQTTLWCSHVELSPKFYTLITERPVPLDTRVLRLIRKSPMALDVYCWATYRVSYLTRDTVIPWRSLMTQIGASYADTPQGRRDFKRRFLDALDKVGMVWPELDITPTAKGLLLKRCAPHVRRKGVPLQA